jgi:hypothetical protein
MNGNNYEESQLNRGIGKTYARELREWHEDLLEQKPPFIRASLTPRRFLRLVQWCKVSATARTLLGMCYYYGIIAPKNHAKARSLFESAVPYHIDVAVTFCSYMLEFGLGGKKNTKRSFKILYDYSQRGAYVFDRYAYILGRCYDFGIGTKIDKQKAIRWYGIDHRKYRYRYTHVSRCSSVNLSLCLAQHSESKMKARFGTLLSLEQARRLDVESCVALGDMLVGNFKFKYPKECLPLLISRLRPEETAAYFYTMSLREASKLLRQRHSPSIREGLHDAARSAKSGLRIAELQSVISD